MINNDDVLEIANALNINFNSFSFDEFKTGLEIELEHGMINPQTNVTNDDLLMTGKIALAHLNEYPNYYNPNYGLSIFEQFLKEKLAEKR